MIWGNKMNKNRNNQTPGNITIIGQTSALNGDISSENLIKIEGKTQGEVKTYGDVYVSRTADVNGNIEARNITIRGIVNGKMKSDGTLRLLPNSKLYGDVCVKGIIIDEGAVFEGKCSFNNIKTTNNLIVKETPKESSLKFLKDIVKVKKKKKANDEEIIEDNTEEKNKSHKISNKIDIRKIIPNFLKRKKADNKGSVLSQVYKDREESKQNLEKDTETDTDTDIKS
jgi:cytoskeletal protein CcmA (bactofilin family)